MRNSTPHPSKVRQTQRTHICQDRRDVLRPLVGEEYPRRKCQLCYPPLGNHIPLLPLSRYSSLPLSFSTRRRRHSTRHYLDLLTLEKFHYRLRLMAGHHACRSAKSTIKNRMMATVEILRNQRVISLIQMPRQRSLENPSIFQSFLRRVISRLRYKQTVPKRRREKVGLHLHLCQRSSDVHPRPTLRYNVVRVDRIHLQYPSLPLVMLVKPV